MLTEESYSVGPALGQSDWREESVQIGDNRRQTA